MAALTPAAAASVTPQRVTLAIHADTEHVKKGPDGKWHDAYVPASFTVHAGKLVEVRITNYDSAVHTFTSTSLGVNIKVKGASASGPTVTSFTFRAPKQGIYTFTCLGPCDPWAMIHLGFMMGRVNVVR